MASDITVNMQSKLNKRRASDPRFLWLVYSFNYHLKLVKFVSIHINYDIYLMHINAY